MVSEEGIFVNMMDDLDPEEGETTNGKSTFSEASDDTCVSGDSMFYSPEELIDDDDLHQDLQNLSLQADGLSGEPFCESPPLNDVRPGDTSDSETLVGVPVVFGLHDEQHQNDTGASETDTNASACAINDAHSSDQHSTKDGAKDSDKKQDSSGGLSITVREWSPHKSDSGGAGAADKGASLDSSYHDLLSPGSSVYEDQEFNFTRAELRKSTSLKSTKTPPGTPRQKKVVRFADAMGLDLESVRHILNLESPPKVPASALKDLQSGLTYDRRSMGTKHIVETFAQPGADINFRDRVLGQKVVLENALVVSGCITGLVRVANISYHKTVRVRFTANNWNTFHDITASYMLNSNDGATDRFSFTISLPPELGPGGRLQFAVSYNVGGIEYWDNNNGQNYVFECFAKTTPTEVENAWMHFL
jgi:protein phosphatase 1 regulatory subunit 3A/B/C/D/E